MPRPKMDKVPFNIRMDRLISERLIQYCEESGQTKTMATERGLQMLMDDWDRKKKKLEEESIL